MGLLKYVNTEDKNYITFLVAVTSIVVTLVGDLWMVICSSTNWRRAEKVRLQHVVTNK